MEENTIIMIATLVTTVIGFIGVIISNNSSVQSAVRATSDSINRRIDDFRADVNRRFDDVNQKFAEVNHRLDDQKSEINLVSTRINTYIDSFAVRLISVGDISFLGKRTKSARNP